MSLSCRLCGHESKIRLCKEQYCIGTLNISAMSQGKLDMFKQEMGRININILGIGQLQWAAMGEFISDDHYIVSCGQEPPRKETE